MKQPFARRRYANNNPDADRRTLRDVLRWLAFGRPEKWEACQSPFSSRLHQPRVGTGELTVTYINHSTLLFQMDGLNILTDPIWSQRCSPFSWIGPKRIIPPGLALHELPPIDIVLVSHDHYDHMDRPTLSYLSKNHHPHFFVSEGNKKRLLRWGINSVDELGWWEKAPLPNGKSVQFVPAQHFARRGLFDRNKTLWGGFVITRKGKSVYFAGDTGYGEHFSEIRQRCGPLQLACLPIGAYLPRWFMAGVHMGPEEAVQAHLDLDAQVSIPIHYGTFQLSDEKIDQPIEELLQELRKRGLSLSHFSILCPGEGDSFHAL